MELEMEVSLEATQASPPPAPVRCSSPQNNHLKEVGDDGRCEG
jgi:hypothetical protein